MYENMFRCGIIETLLLITAVMVLINLSIYLFTRCWFFGTSYNYSEIWTNVFDSKKLSFIPAVLNILSYMTYISLFNFEIYKCASIFSKQFGQDVHHLFVINTFLCIFSI